MLVHYSIVQSRVATFFTTFLILALFFGPTTLPLRVAVAQSSDSQTTASPSNLPAIEVMSENNINPASGDGSADTVAPSLEVTGNVATTSQQNISVQTGSASAGVELSTDANTNEIRSLLGTSTPADLDTYILAATGTNDSVVSNDGTSTALTGDNDVLSDGAVTIGTGDAIAVLNIANVINTNVVNSNGFIRLVNQVVDNVLSWNLQDIFFPESTVESIASTSCSFLSCASEDVSYTVDNSNTGSITNNAELNAISGKNDGVGSSVIMTTGDAYGAANLINVANTNIIDSNYRLVTLNGIGTLDGDLVLPTEALFRAFFGQSNGLNHVEDSEDIMLVDENVNAAQVDNNLNTVAETGMNILDTVTPGTVITGKGSAKSNVINEVNKNLFGGDSLYMLIRVHGAWNGNVFGLPEGLTWTETDEGIIIYNEDAEIVPSEILNYDTDSYVANFKNTNDITIANNIGINAISGENTIAGNQAIARTGDAYAGANVVNIANTNVVGRNWILAIMNILGDFNGNVSFGRPDLWVGGQVQSPASPIGPGAKLVYTYTITNKGDLKATNVKLSNDLRHAKIRYTGGYGEALTATNRDEFIGTLLPGETKIISFDAYVDDTLPVGTSPIESEAKLSLRESDHDKANNREVLLVDAVYAAPVVVIGGGSSGGGGGGGKSKRNPKGKVLGATSEFSKQKIDPKTAPKIIVEKTANVATNQAVKAGEEVSYAVIVANSGGTAYDTKVSDTLRNPIGALVSEQFWDIGVLGAGEKITLEYTIKFASSTPGGFYTNTAHVVASSDAGGVKLPLTIPDAVHTILIDGQAQSVGNVGVTMFVPTGNGKSAALVAWETIKPASSQIFFAPASSTYRFSSSSPNYGYVYGSYLSSQLTTQHYIVLTGLENGKTYSYRLRSADLSEEIMSNEYSFTVPDSLMITML